MKKNKSKVEAKNGKHEKKKDSSVSSDPVSGDSKDMSAFGGGNMRNPSSSDQSVGESQSDPTPLLKPHPKPQEAAENSKVDKVPQKRDLKRPSMQFIEKLNLTEIGSEVEEKGLIPINFGSDEKIRKNKSRRMTNKVRTTKYTWLSWAPLSLLMQFRRAANIYFLIISILTLMPFSPKTPASMIGTFTFVLFVTMLKEALENYFRYKSDKEANNRVCMAYNYNQKKFVETKWKDIRVGDLIIVDKEGKFPVDMLLMVTPNPDGLVFVDTSNLDGETNLKDKSCPIPKLTKEKVVEFSGKIF